MDLPMPGSPPISTSEPFTTPPPSTRSSSPMPVVVRPSASTGTSPMGTGRLEIEAAPTRMPPRAPGSGRSSTSWT